MPDKHRKYIKWECSDGKGFDIWAKVASQRYVMIAWYYQDDGLVVLPYSKSPRDDIGVSEVLMCSYYQTKPHLSWTRTSISYGEYIAHIL